MYVETECPICKLRLWLSIVLDVAQTKTNTVDGTDTIAAYTIKNVEVVEALTELEFINIIKKQIERRGTYTDMKEMEADMIKCFGVARKNTHSLIWRLQASRQKKPSTQDYLLCRMIWFLEGLRINYTRRYFITGVLISVVLGVILYYYFLLAS